LKRLTSEISSTHQTVLICGASAYLACMDEKLASPAKRELTALTPEELSRVNQRFKASFTSGWYMGHTRRWLMRTSETTRTLRTIARSAGWETEP